MIEEFNKFINNYDISNDKIKLKYKHSYRVMELSKKYATMLGFNKHEIEVATVIGLLHDIGRFEQLKLYDSYKDFENIDHADYGVKILFEDELIRNFWKNEEDYDVIKFAIKNHNKYELEFDTDERKMMHAKLIRDIDKLDILYLEGSLNEIDIKYSDDDLSDEIIESLKNKKQIKKTDIKNINDELSTEFAYAFDINNDICLNELKNNIDAYYKRINNDKIFKKVYENIINYIDERIDNYARN